VLAAQDRVGDLRSCQRPRQPTQGYQRARTRPRHQCPAAVLLQPEAGLAVRSGAHPEPSRHEPSSCSDSLQLGPRKSDHGFEPIDRDSRYYDSAQDGRRIVSRQANEADRLIRQ